MKSLRVFTFVIIVCWFGRTAHAEEVRAGGLSLQWDKSGSFRACAVFDPGLLQAAKLRVLDGKRNQELLLVPERISSRGATLTAVYRKCENGTSVMLELMPVKRCLLWKVTCTNLSDQQQWLELGPELLLRSGRELLFWDGYNEAIENPQRPISSAELELNFPVTMAWTKKASVGVGMAPMELVSYLRHDYCPGEHPLLSSCTRIVVDAGTKESVAFVTIGAPGEWGMLEVLDAYYRSFPEFFVPHSGIDPRLNMGSTQYRAWHYQDWSPEICRRLWGGWEWCYAPFRRTGDIVGRAELWDYEPARPFPQDRNMPRAEFLKARQERFERGEKRCNVAMLFYVPSQVWCEEKLAQDRYSDSLVTDPKVRTYFNTPWVTGHDNELRVFPFGTSFGEQSYRDLREVAELLDLSGFAFDCAGGTARYRGAALANLKHRAWDEGGVFCDENVAVAKLMDYVHTLRSHRKPLRQAAESPDAPRLGVCANIGVGCYSSAFHCDTAMFEGEPWKGHRTLADSLRFKLGHKVAVWWEGYELENLIDVNRASAEQVVACYRGLADFTLLQSLRIGLIPPPNFTQGFRRLVQWLPAITDCVQTGWQPIPAVRVPHPLWATRYGEGVQTRLAIAHETADTVQCEAIIQNNRLGRGVHLFAPYHGGSLSNQIRGRDTVVPIVVPKRTPVLLKAVCSIAPEGTVRAAEVSFAPGSTSCEINLSLSANPGLVEIRLPIPPDMKVRTIRPADRTLSGKITGNTLLIRTRLGRHDKLAVQFVSSIFPAEASLIPEFPFVQPDGETCVVVMPRASGEKTRLAAWRVQEYFRYWFGRALDQPREVKLPIVEEMPSKENAVVLRTTPGATPAVRRDAGRLEITAPDEDALHKVVWKMLRLLDTKFFFPDRLPSTALNTKVGLAEKVID